MRRALFCILLASAMVAGCSDDTNDDNPSGGDVGADVQADTQTDAGGDTGPAFEGSEQEPNNTVENANSVDIGEPISGRIAAGSGENSDRDVFQVDLTGGTIFEWEFVSTGAGFEDENGNNAIALFSDVDNTFSRGLVVAVGQKRQAFVPADGTYIVQVYDLRAAADTPTDNGGPDSTYEIATREVTPTPAALASGETKDDQLEDDGVDVFEVSSSADTTFLAETTATRDPVGSDLDTVLYAWDPAASQVIAQNDDFSGQDETFDSRVTFGATSGQTYWVVVDAYTNAVDASYSIELAETDDAPNVRTSLGVSETIDGRIVDRGGSDIDTDYFDITLQPGDKVRLQVDAAGGLQPRIEVFVPSQFGNLSVAQGRPVEAAAAVEFANASGEDGSERTYLVNVDDVRNIPADDQSEPEYVGGEGFSYDLTASEATWEPTEATLPVEESATIADVGTFVWYSFTVPPKSIVGLSGSSDADNFEVQAVGLTDTGIASTGQVYVYDAEAELTAGVRDRYFRGGAGYDFTTSFVAPSYDGVTFGDAAEAEPNDDVDDATALTLPAAAVGTLDGTSPDELKPDFYGLTVSAGDVVGVITEAGSDSAAELADTKITVLDPDGQEVMVNDDYPGQRAEDPENSTFFSAAAFTADADGDYAIKVEPYCSPFGSSDSCDGNGDYTLKVFSESDE